MRFFEKILVFSWWELGEMSIDLVVFENGMGIFFGECLRRPALYKSGGFSGFSAKSRGDFKCKNLTKYFRTWRHRVIICLHWNTAGKPWAVKIGKIKPCILCSALVWPYRAHGRIWTNSNLVTGNDAIAHCRQGTQSAIATSDRKCIICFCAFSLAPDVLSGLGTVRVQKGTLIILSAWSAERT